MVGSKRIVPVTVLLFGVVVLLPGMMIVPQEIVDGVSQQAEPETDNTVTRIDVYANGSAQWTIHIRTRLDTDERAEEYEAFRTRFRNDTSRYLGPFRERMRGVVANAANATGREMQATRFTASTSIQEVPRRWGIVTYQFTWTNFAARTDESVVVGDAFQSGFFIGANDTLTIEGPSNHAIGGVEPEPDSRDGKTVTWVGRADFATDRPHVTFDPNRKDATFPAGRDGLGLMLVGIAAMGFVITTGYTVYRLHGGSAETEQSVTIEAEESSGDSTRPATDPAEQSDGSSSEKPVMTDEERIVALLEENGGRMRQAAIDEEFDWSPSKTSRVIGRLVDEGSIEKRRLGRENLIDLVDDE
ncbi:helix-turn-helix transcriptional regulator [Natrinema halophilum]|uniref:DUF4897 domain-containing protein n=1 Tax=Natrinema halophilum TaxID=1699371 RepID=A0A7D5KM27_9EURY|nr:DUF4897 domain-containing protein [Natrinema halophilum]QLG50478.1 DUF4897 domain-containing protein [Natrinema halophilum]